MMKKPELRITEIEQGIVIKGTCSSCMSVVFKADPTMESAADNLAALDLQFLAHFQKVHVREDASQSAALATSHSG